MINRLEAWKILARHIKDQIVVSTYSSASDWIEVLDRPLNYFSSGAMGLASSHGLGLALARPERKVIVLDGDGSLLMNLGTLVTIGAVAPKNFIHFVGKNRSYEANGGHPIPNRDVDLPGIARSAGIAKAYELSTIEEFEQRIGSLLAEEGPVFVCLNIEQGPLSARDYNEMYKASRRAALHEALNA